jgi:hypothetical protein
MQPKEIEINSSWLSFYNMKIEPKESRLSDSKNSLEHKNKS